MIEAALAQILNAIFVLLVCASIVNLVVLATFLIACLVHDRRARRSIQVPVTRGETSSLRDEALTVLGGGSRGPGEPK